MKEFAALIERALRYLVVILLPSGLGLLLLRAQIVRLILGSGHFGWEQTIATANTLGLFAISLFSQAIVVLLSRSFYSLHNTRTPTILNLIGYAIALGLAFWFAPANGLGLGVPGLALAFSLGSFVNLGLLYWAIRRRVPALVRVEEGLGRFIGRVSLGLLSLIVAVQLAKPVVALFVNMDRFWGVFVQTSVAIVLGAAAYWFTMRVLRVSEIQLVESLIRARFWPNRSQRGALQQSPFEAELPE